MNFFLFLFSLWALGATQSPQLETRIRVGFAGYPSSNLYYLGYDDYSQAVTSLVLEPLVRLNPDSLKPEPALASQFKELKNHTRFEFVLNSKARFSDGMPVTAQDVLFTWQILKSPTPQIQAYASQFSEIDDCTLTQNKIVFSSKKPNPIGLALFSHFYVLSKKHFSTGVFIKDFNETFVGSGPYVFDSVNWGRNISLKRNLHYWGKNEQSNLNKYTLERVEFHVQSDPSLMLQMLLNHEIDYLYFLSAKSWAIDTHTSLFKTGKIRKLEIANRLPFAMSGLAWNLRKPLFQDKKVRKALALLFDRRRLIHDFFYDQYQLATGIAYHGSEYHHPKNLPLPYDPSQAKQLLLEAGWSLNSDHKLEKNGELFSFEVLTGNPPAAKFLTVYQEELRKIGIHLSIKVVDWGTYLKLRSLGQFDAVEFSRNRDEFMNDLDMTWKSNANTFGFSNPKVDLLLESLRHTISQTKRTQIVQTLDKLIAEEYPMAFSWEPRFQRIAYWDQFTFNGKGYHLFSKWNELFHEWHQKK